LTRNQLYRLTLDGEALIVVKGNSHQRRVQQRKLERDFRIVFRNITHNTFICRGYKC
jgi:hypothetical protein